MDRVASLALLSSNAGGWLFSNVPSLELVHAVFDLARTGFADEYTSAEVSLRLHFTPSFLAELVVDDQTGEKRVRREVYHARYRAGTRRDALRDAHGHVFWAHLAAVRSHNLSREESETLRTAPFEKLVIYGADDRVVSPAASRDLARRIGAREQCVRGAHFIVDEAAMEVNQALAALWRSAGAAAQEASRELLGSYVIRSLVNYMMPPQHQASQTSA
jgi:pimeloyl-ACP methyl ester carboxylesterase